MIRKHKEKALFLKAFAWIALALFALTLAGFAGHAGCCHFHDTVGEVCPVCESFFRVIRLLRLAALAGMAAAAQSSLCAACAKALLRGPEAAFRADPVSLCVKLTD